MESQSHGFDFEDKIVKSITGIDKREYQNLLEGKYTSSMDIVKGVKSNHDYSVKVAKANSGIGGGDIIRFFNHSKNGFKLIVGVWEQKTSTKKVYNVIYEFDIQKSDFELLWSKIPQEELLSFTQYVKSIPSGRKAQKENSSIWKEKRKDIYNKYGKGLVDIAAKIDSKTQRRVQCSIGLKDLLSSPISRTTHTKQFRGIILPYEQKSTSRKFKKA